jgi:cyanate permease
MYGLGSLSVIIGSLCALIVHFFAFVMYGFIGIDLEMIPDRFVWVFRIPYILASMGVAYFIAWIYLGRKKSGVKFEPASKTQFDTATPQFSAVKLWTPNTIGFYTVFFGFPSGILLSSINWIRMGLNKKALYHLVAGLVGIFAIITILLIIPGNLGRGISGLINIGMAVYLNSQIKKDIAFFISNNREIQNAHWSWCCLISLLMVGFYFLLAMIVVMVLMFLGIPIPEQ